MKTWQQFINFYRQKKSFYLNWKKMSLWNFNEIGDDYFLVIFSRPGTRLLTC